MRIKLKGGPRDGEWVEVREPPQRQILFVEMPKQSASAWTGAIQHFEPEFQVGLKRHIYQLCLYKTTRFGGRKFYRYEYKGGVGEK